jgi:hypothetical protein
VGEGEGVGAEVDAAVLGAGVVVAVVGGPLPAGVVESFVGADASEGRRINLALI